MTTRVLYITGWCRSGSTLLGNLLNELDGVVHVGELHYLWANGVLGAGTNSWCGCGGPIRGCALWSSVLAQFGDHPSRLAAQMVAAQQRLLRTRHTGERLAEAMGSSATPPEVIVALNRMAALYLAIARRSNAELVVDSSKYPAEAAALCGRSDLDVRVLHLVRDPRATAHSWRRSKEYIPPMGVWRSGSYWTAFNLASDRIGASFPGRYLRLTYEEFAERPRESVAAVMRLAGLHGPPPVSADGSAVLGVNHTVTGNPDRLRQGPVQVVPDGAWTRELPRPYAALATALAAPALRRYGYRIR
ncbi:MAG TPA: sulfotransferase [Micromonosporaceae bacterium]|nr:sulfotransferase [Micromonosporaceae bacterium]